jgi:hypothetical protein
MPEDASLIVGVMQFCAVGMDSTASTHEYLSSNQHPQSGDDGAGGICHVVNPFCWSKLAKAATPASLGKKFSNPLRDETARVFQREVTGINQV